MAIMTIDDRLALIASNHASIKRALKNGNNDAVAEFFRNIATVATEAADLYKSMESNDPAAPLAPAP